MTEGERPLGGQTDGGEYQPTDPRDPGRVPWRGVDMLDGDSLRYVPLEELPFSTLLAFRKRVAAVLQRRLSQRDAPRMLRDRLAVLNRLACRRFIDERKRRGMARATSALQNTGATSCRRAGLLRSSRRTRVVARVAAKCTATDDPDSDGDPARPRALRSSAGGVA